MAEYGFYRGSGAAWPRALPPEVQRIGDEAALHRCWALLVLDREGARRLAGQGPAPLCGTVLLPQDVWPEPLRARQPPPALPRAAPALPGLCPPASKQPAAPPAPA